jgi:uncharacterized membrane protein YcaP (DUF421 family)
MPDWILGSPDGLLRTVVVGLLAYVALIGTLRISGKRTLAKLNAFDLVVTVAFGSVLATALLSPDVSLLSGATAIVLLALVQFLVSWTAMRSERVERAIKNEPALLVLRGQVLHDALQRERIQQSEIHQVLRNQGIARVEDAGAVVLETDGSLSVLSEAPAAGAGTLGGLEPTSSGRP